MFNMHFGISSFTNTLELTIQTITSPKCLQPTVTGESSEGISEVFRSYSMVRDKRGSELFLFQGSKELSRAYFIKSKWIPSDLSDLCVKVSYNCLDRV